MRNIIIIGNGGHAKSCCDVIELEKNLKLLVLYLVIKI